MSCAGWLGLVLLLTPTVTWAAFPTVVGTPTETQETNNSGTHSINLPASPTVGNLLVAFVACRDSTGTISWAGSFTQIFQVRPSALTSVAWYTAAYRVVTGSEGSTVTVTTSTTGGSCAGIVYEIAGQHASTPPECTTATVDTSGTVVDPPSHTASWGGTEDVLWITGGGVAGTITWSTWPTNYTNLQDAVSSSGNNGSVGTARRNLAAGSDDPSAFTLNVASRRSSSTCAIRPSSAAVSFVTGAHTVTGGPGSLVFLTVYAEAFSGTPVISTVSGHGCTWSLVRTQNSAPVSQSTYRCAPSSNSTDTITIIYAGAVPRVSWTVIQALGVDDTGSGCTGGVVQCASGVDTTGLDLVATLAAYSSSDNRPLIIGTSSTIGTNATVEAGWTELSDFTPGEAGRMVSMWRNDTTDTSGTLIWDSGTDATKLWIALELKAVVIPAPPTGFQVQ